MTQTRERGPAGEGLAVTLSDLHAANKARQTEWCVGGDPEPDLAFRGNELAGETGEACNVIKKLERERHGWRGSRASLDDLAQELADVIICTDLCAITAGIDLAAAVVAKFNATSEKQGLSTKLAPASQAAPVAGVEGEIDRLRAALEWARSILGNMAMEHETGWRSVFARWPIHHEPLRSDARAVLPIIDAALENRS